MCRASISSTLSRVIAYELQGKSSWISREEARKPTASLRMREGFSSWSKCCGLGGRRASSLLLCVLRLHLAEYTCSYSESSIPLVRSDVSKRVLCPQQPASVVCACAIERVYVFKSIRAGFNRANNQLSCESKWTHLQLLCRRVPLLSLSLFPPCFQLMLLPKIAVWVFSPLFCSIQIWSLENNPFGVIYFL